MVEELARDFGVLEVSDKGQEPSSIVNRQVLEAFATGKHGLIQEDCDGEVLHTYYTLLHKLRVPWVQGVLKAAFVFSDSDSEGTGLKNHQYLEEQRGKGSAHLAALLPDLYKCDPDAATIIANELSILRGGTEVPDYEAIRDALEHQYQCLGVTCDDIGGFLNPQTGEYFEDTRPCGGYGTKISQRRERVVVSGKSSPVEMTQPKSGGFSSGGVFVVALAILAVLVELRARGQKAMVSRANHWLTSHQQYPKEDPSYSYSTTTTSDYNRMDYEVQLRPLGENHVHQDEDDRVVL